MTSTPPARLGARTTADEAVEGSRFLERLPDAARARLTGMFRMVACVQGEVVLREGSITPFLAIVASGRVALRLLVPERGPTTVLTVEPGELLGWSVLVPPFRSTATAVALEQTELAVIDGPALRAAIEDDASLAAAVLPRVLEAVAGRLGESWYQLLDLFAGAGVEPW
jgi:CRP-like cAMP-binding protein